VKPYSIKKLESLAPSNKIVFKVRSFDELEAKAKEFEELKPTVVDNHALETKDVITWIVEELECSTEIANRIYNRTNGRLGNIMTSVRTLSMLDYVGVAEVNLYVDKVQHVTVQNIVEWILRINRPGVKKEDLIELVYEFRFAQSWLLTTISQQLNLYVKVLTYAGSSELSLKNYHEFSSLSEDKDIQKLSEYRLKRILRSFGEVSLEYVYYVKSVIDSISKRDKLGLYKLIQLIKLGGN
jgi:hypothetical protein